MGESGLGLQRWVKYSKYRIRLLSHNICKVFREDNENYREYVWS